MRISDWSSDVCSSDLGALGKEADVAGHGILLVQCMTAATWSSSTRLSRRTTALPLWKPRTSSISWLWRPARSEEHTSELQSLMRTSYAVFCLKKKTKKKYEKLTALRSTPYYICRLTKKQIRTT